MTFSADALTRVARIWLYEHGYVLPSDKRVTLLVRGALRHAEAVLSRRSTRRSGTETIANWVTKLVAPREGEGGTVLEWLRAAPHRAGRRDNADYVVRAQVLRELGAGEGDWTDIAEARLYHYAKAMLRRRPSAVRRLREPRRTVEVAWYLRRQLLRVTDTILGLADHRIADLWRGARERVEDAVALQLANYQRAMATVIALAGDPSISDQAFRERVRAVAAPFSGAPASNRTAAIRKDLSGQSAIVRPLRKQLMEVQLELPTGHPLATALPALRSVYANGDRVLPEGTNNPFAQVWAPLIDSAATREAALGAYEAATLMMLKRSLRNGSASTRQSLSHRAPDDVLVPGRTVRHMFLVRSVVTQQSRPRAHKRWNGLPPPRPRLLRHDAAHNDRMSAHAPPPLSAARQTGNHPACARKAGTRADLAPLCPPHSRRLGWHVPCTFSAASSSMTCAALAGPTAAAAGGPQDTACKNKGG